MYVKMTRFTSPERMFKMPQVQVHDEVLVKCQRISKRRAWITSAQDLEHVHPVPWEIYAPFDPIPSSGSAVEVYPFGMVLLTLGLADGGEQEYALVGSGAWIMNDRGETIDKVFPPDGPNY